MPAETEAGEQFGKLCRNLDMYAWDRNAWNPSRLGAIARAKTRGIVHGAVTRGTVGKNNERTLARAHHGMLLAVGANYNMRDDITRKAR